MQCSIKQVVCNQAAGTAEKLISGNPEAPFAVTRNEDVCRVWGTVFTGCYNLSWNYAYSLALMGVT